MGEGKIRGLSVLVGDAMRGLGCCAGSLGERTPREPSRRRASSHPRTPRNSLRSTSPTAWPVARSRRRSPGARRSRASPERPHSRLDSRPLDRVGASQDRETVSEAIHLRHRRPEIGRTVDPHPRDAAPERGDLRAEEGRPRSETSLVHRQVARPHLDVERSRMSSRPAILAMPPIAFNSHSASVERGSAGMEPRRIRWRVIRLRGAAVRG